MTKGMRQLAIRSTACILVLLLFGAMTGCGSRYRLGVRLDRTTRFSREIERYFDFPPQKCLALAGDPEGVYVIGYAFSAPSREAAIEGALADCEQRRVDRGISTPCALYALGDEVATAAAKSAGPAVDAPPAQ